MPDWWAISIINPNAAERIGYPTQKPRGLLERIISASSNEDDVILDPFCGCGTTVDAAEKLHRQWIGIDVTHYAVTLIEGRLERWHPSVKYDVHGRPADLAGAHDLANRDKHQFQWWASWRLGAQTYREREAVQIAVLVEISISRMALMGQVASSYPSRAANTSGLRMFAICGVLSNAKKRKWELS